MKYINNINAILFRCTIDVIFILMMCVEMTILSVHLIIIIPQSIVKTSNVFSDMMGVFLGVWGCSIDCALSLPRLYGFSVLRVLN